VGNLAMNWNPEKLTHDFRRVARIAGVPLAGEDISRLGTQEVGQCAHEGEPNYQATTCYARLWASGRSIFLFLS